MLVNLLKSFKNRKTLLWSRNSCIFVPACGMRRFTMAGMTKKTVQQATPTTNSNSNTSTSTVQNSTNVQNSTVSSPMSNSNSNVSSSMSNSSYTVPSPMSSSSSTTSSSNSNSSSSWFSSAVNFVANITHPNNYLHTSNPSSNFTTSQVSPQPLTTINCGDSERSLSFNLPALATFTGEAKQRDCWVSQIILGYQGHNISFNVARMLTHASGRLNHNGEWQHHQQIALTDVNKLSRIQFLTELRIRINNPEFIYKNFSAKTDHVVHNECYKETKESLKMLIVLLQDPLRFDTLMTTHVIDQSITATQFKILYQIAKQNDPNLFS